jgi:VWFA-related protein
MTRTLAALHLFVLYGPVFAQTAVAPGPAAKAPEPAPVRIDAVVTDQAGVPVHGLTAADFRVFADGKEQAITAFQAHGGPVAPGLSGPQRIVLLIGPQSSESQQWVQQSATEFVAGNTGPNRLTSVIFTDVCLNTSATPFLADAAMLQHALNPWPDLLHCDRPAAPAQDLRPLYYAQVAESMTRVPGPKAVVLFVATAGPLADAAGDTRQEAAPSTHRNKPGAERHSERHRDPYDMEYEFRKAAASVYPVEPQTGVALPGWALSLADVTGGHALSRGALHPLAREQNESYMLSFSPGVSAEGSCHDVKVTVNRPDVHVFGRNLYCNFEDVTAVPAAKPGNDLDSLAASARSGNTEASASAPFFYEANGVVRVNLALEIPAPVLEPTERNGKVHAEIDMLGMAYVPGGAIAARFTHKLQFDFDTRRQFEDFVQRPLHCEHQFEILPGKYRFKVVFRSSKSSFGAVELPLEIDPFDPARLSLSAIALSRSVQPISPEAAQDQAEAGERPLIFRGNRIIVSAAEVLPRSGTAEAYFEVYEPLATGAAAVPLTMRLRLLDVRSGQERWNSGDVDLSSLTRSANRIIPVALRLPVASLPAGPYRAELTVNDPAGGRATRSIEFRTQ